MSDLTAEDIRRALRDCYDATLPCNLVDLGTVHAVSVIADPDAPGAGIPGVPTRFRITVTLTPVHTGDDALAHLRAQVHNRLAGLEQAGQITVEIAAEPAWTPARILPAGRRALGLEGNPGLVQIKTHIRI